MSDVGQAIGALAGAVIGFFVGGVGGAIRGAAFGYSLTAPRQKEQSPTYSFGNKYNTASQTIPVPVVYGKNLVAGNALYKKVSGTNNEKMALQISLSEGPIQSVTAIKADDVDITSKSRVKLGNRVQSADAINEHGQTFPLTAYISTELTANENLSGSPTITSIVEGRKIAVWNGSSWVEQYSQNPAFAILDFLRNPIYGLGWVDEDIDLNSFIDAAAYCDGLVDDGLGGQEKRFQLDCVIDFQQASPDHIVDMLMTFRAFLTYNQGMISLNIDGPNEVPVQDFDMDNIVEGSLVYREAKKDERLNKVIVNFTDEEDNFEVQGVYASMDGDIKRRGLIDDTFNLHGVNRRTQAGRMAHYFQRKTFFGMTTVEFRAGVDSIHCEAGNVVRITHDVPGWNQKWFRILYIKEYQNDEMIIYAQNYNKAVYDDAGVVQQVKRDTTLPNPFALPASVVGLSLIEQVEVLGDGTWIPQIKVSWIRPDYIVWKAGNIYISDDGGLTWQYITIVEDEEYVIAKVAPGTYKVKIVSENKQGSKEDFGLAAIGQITVLGKDVPPSDVTWGPCSFDRMVRLNWQPITDPDRKFYEVRTDTNFGSSDEALVFKGDALSIDIIPQQRSYTFYIAAMDRSGNYSVNATPLTIENTIPIAPPQPTITEFFGSLWIEVAPNGESDIEKYNVYITPSDGAGNPTGATEKIILATAPNKITYEASPGQSFLVEIAAEDVLGEGLKSAPVEAATKHVEAPDIPDGLLTESKLENSLQSKIDSAKSNSDDYANQVIAYPTEENGLLTELTGNDYLLKYSAGDVYVGAEIEIDPNGFFDLTDQNDNELVDAIGNPVTITDIKDESGISLLGPGTPTWYGSNMGEEIHLMVSNSPAVDFKFLYGVKKNLSGLSVDAMLKRGVTAKQIDANVVDSIEAMRGFAWNNPVPADKTLLGVETRVTNNETGISSNQTSISQNATTIQTNATNITAAENNITANQTSIQQNADGINVNAAKIQTNENDISANSASIQVNADSIQNTVSELHSSKWQNLFTSWDGGEWIKHVGNPTVSVVDEPTAINGKVLQVVGFGWYSLNENIPFDPESMYIIKIRARQTVDDIGRNRIYCGVNGVAANGIALINTLGANTWSGQHYVAVSGHTLTVADGWKEWTGYIQGYSTLAGWQSNNPQDPGKMYPGVTFIRPMFIVNHSVGTGTAQIDYMILKLDSKESWSQVNQLANEYTVKLQQHVNGQDYIAGFGLAIDGGISEFGILADRFKIYGNPADPGETATPVFALDTHSGKLFLLADLIADGTITARMIGANEIIANTSNIKDAIIDNAKIINVEANKITTNEAKIQSAQIESIQTEQIKVGGQPAKLVNPKPQGAQLWHFDRSAVSTDGLQPEAGAVYTLRPGEGKYGGAVAVEEGTTNHAINNYAVGELAHSGTSYRFWGETYTYAELGLANGQQITFSVDLKIDQIRKNAGGSVGAYIYSYNPNDSWGQYVNKGTTETEYNRYSMTFTRDDSYLLSDGNPADRFSCAIYRIPIEIDDGTSYAKRMQIEIKPFPTSFVDGTRAGGNLSYKPSKMGIDLNEGAWTIACWAKYKGYQMTAGVRAPVLELGGYYLAGETSWTVGPRQSTNRLYLVLYSNQETEKHGGYIQYTSSEAIDWILVVLRKINSNTVELVTVSKESGLQKVSVSSTQWASNPIRDNLYVGRYDWTERMNGLIDELIVVPGAVSDEEIQSWYNAQAPFFDNAPVQSAGSIVMNTKGMQIKGTDGIEIIGQTGDRAVLNEDLLAFYKAGSNVPNWYTKQVAHGTAQDGDYITLNWDKKPKVIVAVKDLRSYTYSESGQNYSNSNQDFYAYAPESEITENGFRVLCRSIVQGAENVWDIPDQILMDGVEWPSELTPIATTTKMQIGLKAWHISGSYASIGASRILWYYQKEGQSSWTYHGSGVSNPRGNFLFTNSTSTYTMDGLPPGKYKWKVRAIGAHDGEFRTRIQWWKYWGDVVIDIGTATWIAIEGGAD